MLANALLQIAAGILILAGLVIRYQVKRTRFNRRNLMGIEQFRNYEHFILIRFIERTGLVFGKLLVLAGIVVAAWAYVG